MPAQLIEQLLASLYHVVSGSLDLLLNERSCNAMLRWLARKP
jgi:hypothetical protein